MNNIVLSCLFCPHYLESVRTFYSGSLWWIVLGILGIIGVVVLTFAFFFFPIKRDVQLAKKKYWLWILVFMVSTALAMQFWAVLYHVWHTMPHHVLSLSTEPKLLRDMIHFFIGSLALPEGLKYGGTTPTIMLIIKVFLVNGIVVATIVSLFNRRIGYYREGKLRYKSVTMAILKNKYAVVIGANEVAASVIKNLLVCNEKKANKHSLNCHCEHNYKYILLQTNRKAEDVRNMLQSHLTEKELDRVIIYTAYRDSKTELKKLCLEYASEIHILGENTAWGGTETFHDTVNMRCVNMVASLLREYKNSKYRLYPYTRKLCRVMFEYQTTYSVFQFSDISSTISETLDFVPFNRYESWARKVLAENRVEDHGEVIQYTPLDGFQGIKPQDKEHVHFVVVGMSNMGIALGIQALAQMHYLDANSNGEDIKRSRLTFIDAKADKEMAFFKGRYATLFELARHRYVDVNDANQQQEAYQWVDPMAKPDCKWKHLSEGGRNFLDVEIEFVKGELESDGVRQYLCDISDATKHCSKLTIAICLTQAHQAIAASLYMPIEVYKNPQLQQILVYQREAKDIIQNLTVEREKDIRYQKLNPFGMLYANYLTDRTHLFKAMLVNAAYNIINDPQHYPWPKDMLDKHDEGRKQVEKLWNDLHICKQLSNKLFVDTIYQKIRGVMDVLDDNQRRDLRYNGSLYEIPQLQTVMKTAIESRIGELAVCEKNRWNLEKLLFGFFPCDETDDKALQQYVQNGTITDERAHKQLKDAIKSSDVQTHPDICDYAHMDMIDPPGKEYDAKLCLRIPEILILIDGYGKCQLH